MPEALSAGSCWYELVPVSRRHGDQHERQAGSFPRRGSDSQHGDRARRRAQQPRPASAHSDAHASSSPEHLLDAAVSRHAYYDHLSSYAARGDTVDAVSSAPKWKSSASIDAESRRQLPVLSDQLRLDEDRWQAQRESSPVPDEREAQQAAAQRFRRKLPSLPDPLNLSSSRLKVAPAAAAAAAAEVTGSNGVLRGASSVGVAPEPRHYSSHQHQHQHQLQHQQLDTSSASGSCSSIGGWPSPYTSGAHVATVSTAIGGLSGPSSARSRRQLAMAVRSNTLTAYDADVRERADEADLPDMLRRVGSEGVAMNALEHIGQHQNASSSLPAATLVNSSLNSSASIDQEPVRIPVDEPPIEQTRAAIAAAAAKTDPRDSKEDLLRRAAVDRVFHLECAEEEPPAAAADADAEEISRADSASDRPFPQAEQTQNKSSDELTARPPIDPEVGVTATPAAVSEMQPSPAMDRRRARGGVTRKISQVVFGKLGLYKKSRSSSQLHLGGGLGVSVGGASGRCSFQRSQEVGSAASGASVGGSTIGTVPEVQNFVDQLGPGQVLSRSALGSSPLGELEIRLFGAIVFHHLYILSSVKKTTEMLQRHIVLYEYE